MDKPLVLVFYGEDGVAAKKKAAEIRAEDDTKNVNVRDATVFADRENAERVVIMPDVTGGARDRLMKAYGDLIEDADVEAEESADHDPDEDTEGWKVERIRGKFYMVDADGNKKSTGYRRRVEAEDVFRDRTGREPPDWREGK